MVVLTPAQAQHNKALFERRPRSSLSSTPLQPAPAETAASIASSISAEGTSASCSVSNATVKSGFPPPPNATIFSDPSYHEHVISTFFSTAMTVVNYTPNSPMQSPEQQAIGFNNFLIELIRYAFYLPNVHAMDEHYEHASSDCGPLLKWVEGFIQRVESEMGASNAAEVAASITSMITSAVQALGSSPSEKVEKTLFNVFRVNGAVVGRPYPVGSIFWSSVTVARHQEGKSTVERQRVVLRSFSYMIDSPVVVANADALASAFAVGASDFANAINVSLRPMPVRP